MFVSDVQVPVTLDNSNVIYIRPKMGVGVRNKLISLAAHMTGDLTVDAPTADLDMGAYNTALLKLNIMSWTGPSFDGVPCTPANIERLDPDEPLVGEVLREINARNLRKPRVPDNDPNPSAAAGNTSSTES